VLICHRTGADEQLNVSSVCSRDLETEVALQRSGVGGGDLVLAHFA
jgi:hypothetical protein